MFGVVWYYYSLELKGKQCKQNTSPKSYKTEIKLLAKSGFEQLGPVFLFVMVSKLHERDFGFNKSCYCFARSSRDLINASNANYSVVVPADWGGDSHLSRQKGFTLMTVDLPCIHAALAHICKRLLLLPSDLFVALLQNPKNQKKFYLKYSRLDK